MTTTAMISTRWPQRCAAFVIALLITHIVASVSQSFFTLQALRSIGVELHWGDWLATIGRDLYGLALRGAWVPYGALLLVALALALPVAGLIRRRIGGDWLYAMAGAVGVGVLLALAHQFFMGEHLISATRTLPAQLSQVVAGALGGAAYVCTLRRLSK